MTTQSDWVTLTSFSFRCILGLRDREQREAQPLEVQLAMGLDLDAAAGGDLSVSVNYTTARDQLKFIAEHGRWRLLESMAAAMAAHLLAPPAPGERRAQIDRVRLSLRKPEAFRGEAIPGIEILRDRSWRSYPDPAALPAEIRITSLQETRETGAYHVALPPGQSWSVPAAARAYVLAGAIDADGHACAAGRAAAAGGPLVPPGASRVAVVGPGSARLLVICLPPLRRSPAEGADV